MKIETPAVKTGTTATADHVARWHRAGRAVHVWTVDEEAEIRRLAELKVDALITNDPARTRAALGPRGQ